MNNQSRMQYGSVQMNKPGMSGAYLSNYSRPMGSATSYQNNMSFNSGYQNNFNGNGDMVKAPLMLYGTIPTRHQYSSQRATGTQSQKKKSFKKDVS